MSDSIRLIIVKSMARALFVSAYADAAEEADRDDLSPGPGGDWMHVAPETSTAAMDKASQLADNIEHINATTLDAAFAKAKDREPGVAADKFGHYLGMEALGSGVGWSDDHEDHGLEVPDIEFWLDAEELPAKD